MNSKTKFLIKDILLILLAVVPFAAAIILNVLTKPLPDGIDVTGAQIYLTVKMPIQDLYITEAQITSLCVMISVLAICLYLTNGLGKGETKKRHLVAEIIVDKVSSFVKSNMGERFSGFAPFVAAMMALSGLSSLSSLLGLYPATSDLNIVAGWAILVFVLITHYKLKAGPLNYLKGFTEPIPLFTPFNIISEIATPVSMAFRHYGNVLSGVVISTLVAAGLGGLSSMLLGWLPGILGEIPFLRIGLPAILSVYFDLFSGCLQAFIFAMLTMLYVSSAFPEDEYEKRLSRKKLKKANKI